MDLRKRMSMTFGVEYSGDLSSFGLPNENIFFEGYLFDIGIGKPYPVIPARDMSAEFPLFIGQHHLP